jgi:hypothetical protein
LRKGDRQIKSHEYSAQVPNIVYEARRTALHELAEGIIHGTDHLETMLLIDVSGSMTWNPHGGMMGKHSCLVLLVPPIIVSLGWFLETKSRRFFFGRLQVVYPNFYYFIFLIPTYESESISTNYTGLIEQALTESFATMTNPPTSASLSTLSEESCTT